MKGADVVNRLKEVLPNYTDDFSDIITISSLSRSATTITAVTGSAHGLATGNYVTIRGAKEPITISSITRDEEVVTVTTATDHKLSSPALFSPKEAAKLTVEISGAVPTDYNGTFTLLTAPTNTTFTYRITTTPASPATTPGTLLLPDFDGYNGYKQVTVTNTTTFTYTTTNSSLGTPAQGTLQMSNASRIAWSATAQRADKFYSEDQNRQLQNWLFVVMGSKTVYKDGTVASDVDGATDTNELYFYKGQQDFSLFIFLPSQANTLSGETSDIAYTLEQPLLKSIVNFGFPSVLNETCYQPTVYVGNESEDYNTAYYIHRYDFNATVYVKEEDTVDVNPGVPLQSVDGTITDKNMTFKPTTR
jgi:hypothetical protein